MSGPSPSATAVAMFPTTSDDEQVRALLQERLTLFLRTALVLVTTVSVAFGVAFELYPVGRPRPTANVLLVSLLVALAIVAWRIGRAPLPMAALRRIDALIALASGLFFGLNAALALYLPEHLFVTCVDILLVTLARAIVVPSTARRTLALSTTTVLLTTVGMVVVVRRAPQMLHVSPIVVFVGFGALFGVGVLLATFASSVLYGLRRQIREAQRLGQYTLGEKIGEGGMGAVYRAEHALLRRPTALKLLPLEKAGAEAIRRFEREVQLTSALTHPNTVAIFDYGRSADGVFYYAMELLDGIDLERLVRTRGPLPAARVVHVLRQVCDALHEAHSRGLVHRDIKPANVILCRRGLVPDVVKVVDFGLVRDLRTALDGNTAQALVGTPAYLAPEAITAPDTVGPQSDLYAVGALGYFLLTGTTVFGGSTLHAVCDQHVRATPAPPSTRTDRVVPAPLEQLVLACLAKRPEDRPAGARQLRTCLDDLARTLAWSEEDAQRWWDEYEASPRPAGVSTTGLSATMVAVDLDDRTHRGSG